jgi:hypothetical protein
VHHRHPSAARRARRPFAAALIALAVALTPASALAAEGTFTQLLCANPDSGQGLGVPSVDGMTTPASAGAWQASITARTCSTGPRGAANAITLAPSSAASVPYNGYAALHYRVADPALTLESARHYRAFASGNHPFEVSTRIAQHGGADAGEIAAPVNGFDAFWSGQSQSAGRADQPFAPENIVNAEHNGRSFSVTAQCHDTGATCAHGAGEWSYRFFGGEARLRDTAVPTVEALSGSLVDGGSIATEQISFRAADAGAGLYRFKLQIDGDDVDVRDLTTGADLATDDRQATCFDVNPQNADPYEFAHQQPCPASLERTLSVSTASASDGPHRLRAVVEDAGGNEAVLVDREVVVDNHPAPELVDGLPPIAGTPAVGTPLTGANGSWRDAARYDFYWERCPTETSCTLLADHTGRTYVPTADDVGARLRFVVVATNGVGEWTASTSPYSAPVARAGAGPTGPGDEATTPTSPTAPGRAPGAAAPDAGPPAHGAAAPPASGPNGRGASRDVRLTVATRRGARKLRTRFASRTPIAGRLTDAAGRPIAGAVLQIAARPSSAGATPSPLGTTVTGEDGGFAYTVPGGPSRRIDIAYRASLADDDPVTTASVRIVVAAQLSLRVRPARPGRTTWMTGHLLHLPRAGVQIQVQALDGRRWRTFDTTTTRRGGRFRYGYRFKPTAAGRRFSLRVLVASPVYPFARGVSRASRIRVPG